MPIDGLSSGLDTTSIINQLMQLERQPIVQLTARKTKAQTQLDAFTSVRARLTALNTAATDLSKPAGWNLRSATSSNSEVATVSAANGAAISNISFTVDQVASRHGVATAEVANKSTVISNGTLELTIGGVATTISTGSGTLQEVAAAINSAGAGLSATAVNTGSGYRLQINANSSGSDSTFTIDSGLTVASAVTSQGANAQLTIGSGAGAYQVTSNSNVFSEVFDGLTVTAKSVSATSVTLNVAPDASAIADKVETLVNGLAAALAEMKTRTSYNAKSNSGSSLAGDSALRRLTQELTSALVSQVGGPGAETASSVGISLDRYGVVSFDRAAFETAFNAAPDAVQGLFANGATSTGGATYISSGVNTVAGDYDVVVTSPAQQATVLGMVGSFPITTPHTIRVRVGNVEISYATNALDDAATVRDGLQSAIDAGGLNITVASEGGGLSLTSAAFGTSATFDVAFDGTNYETAQGTDVEGTIDGQTATGSGNTLSAPPGSGNASGLVVSVTPGATGAMGTVSFGYGLAGKLAAIVGTATDSVSGYITGAESERTSRITLFTSSIQQYEDRMVLREARLRREYAALESALASLQSQGSYLTQQISSLSNS